MPQSIHEFTATRNDGTSVSLGDYAGKVVLVVNTASQCGFTPQYDGLETLQADLGEQGFAVLGFPCNQFGKQEPGSDAEIRSFCETRFSTTFPLFQKVDVNGRKAHPLFTYLKGQAPGVAGTKSIKWNFTKFLVDRDGRVQKRFAPKETPEAIRGEIETLLRR